MSLINPINCDNTWLTLPDILRKIVRKDGEGDIVMGVHGLETLCAEYIPVYKIFTKKPSEPDKTYQSDLVCDLVAAHYWPRIDIMRVYANHTNANGEACLNWKNPALYGATIVNAPIHTFRQGFLFNGTTQYLNNNWVPSVSGVNYTQNSASQILYIRTDIASTGIHGTSSNNDLKDCYIWPRRNTNDWAYIRINDDTYVNSGSAINGSGLFINTRTAAAVNKLYRNGVAIINGTTASTGVPTHSPYTGAGNDDNVAGYFRADQVAIEIWMDGCTQEDVTGITNILNNYMTKLGTNVF